MCVSNNIHTYIYIIIKNKITKAKQKLPKKENKNLKKRMKFIHSYKYFSVRLFFISHSSKNRRLNATLS